MTDVLSCASLREEKQKALEEKRILNERLDEEFLEKLRKTSETTYQALMANIRIIAKTQDHVFLYVGYISQGHYSLCIAEESTGWGKYQMLQTELTTERPSSSIYKVVGTYIEEFWKKHGGDLKLENIKDGSWKLSW